MYPKKYGDKTSLYIDQTFEGETIEEKVERIVNNDEPITDGAPLVYTDRSEGVDPNYNVRTDRFELAVDALDIFNKSTNWNFRNCAEC